MKNKGTMISLAALVVIGVMITMGTHHFIEKNSVSGIEMTFQVTAAAMEDAAGAEETEAEIPLAADAEEAVPMEEGDFLKDASGEQQAQERSRDLAGGWETYAMAEEADAGADVAKEDEPALTSGMEKTAGVISSGEIAGTPSGEPEELEDQEALDTVTAESLSYYVKRLQDLDSQIQKNKERQAGTNVNSSVKSAASNELKLWDSELNDIYNAVLDKLGKEESEELVKEEREWLKERDSLAMDAAKKYTGGSSESIEYTLSLVESTRQRAYELAERYGQVLEE